MIFTTAFKALHVLVLPILAVAQHNRYAQAPSTVIQASSVPSAPADTTGRINIDVAFNQAFVFHPASITAPNGTIVTFFFPTGFSHSVTQSSFDSPCTYLAASEGTGFDSGLTQATQFTLNVTNDAEPIYYHCKQSLHCGQGMVGTINAPSSGKTFESFKAAALKIGNSEPTETDTGPVTGGVGAVATAGPRATYNSGTRVAASGISSLIAVGLAISLT
jgi:plastocyanin